MKRPLLLYFANPLTGKGGLESETIDMARTMSQLQTRLTLICVQSLDPSADENVDRLMHAAGVRIDRIPLSIHFYLDPSLEMSKVPSYFRGLPAFWMRSMAAAIREVVSQSIRHAIIWHSFTAFPVAFLLKLIGVRTFGYGHPLASVGVKRLFASWSASKLSLLARLVASVTIAVLEGVALASYSWFRVSSPSQTRDMQLRRFCGRKMGVIPPGLQLSDIPIVAGQDEMGIAYFGALEDWWDIGSLITAFEKISGEFPGASLHIFGGGSREREIRELVTSLNSQARSKVHLYGPIPRDQLLKRFDKFGIAVVPLRYSPSNGSVPMKLIEAAAAGKAIIGTTTPGIPEYFANRALLIPPKEPKAMSEALRLLLSNSHLRHELAAKANAAALQFDSSLVCEKFLKHIFET